MEIEFDFISSDVAHTTGKSTCKAVAIPDKGQYMFIVCDGIEEYPYAPTASRVVAEAFCHYWETHKEASLPSGTKMDAAAKEAIGALNAQEPQCGMATTMSLISIDGKDFMFAYAGNTRVITSKKRLMSVIVSRPHSELDGSGKIHIVCAFRQGCQDGVSPISYQYDGWTDPDDIYMICTDSLMEVMDDKTVHGILKNKEWSYRRKVEALRQLAQKVEGDYSAIIIHVIPNEVN